MKNVVFVCAVAHLAVSICAVLATQRLMIDFVSTFLVAFLYAEIAVSFLFWLYFWGACLE